MCDERPEDADAALDRRPARIAESLDRLLRLPTVADKSFLITIGDRTVGGLVSRDQMVGPWQVPVADVAVSLSDFEGYAGEAMAMGERAPVAVLDAPASGRLAVGEAITNIIAADVAIARRYPAVGELDGGLRRAGRGCGPVCHGARRWASDLCAELGITIPVGKDSLSMRTAWTDERGERSVVAPVSLVDLRLRAGRGRAAHAHARARSLAVPRGCCSSISAPGKTAWADPCWAQVFERRGGAGARPRRPAAAACAVRGGARAQGSRSACSPITTAPTAACS